MPIAEAKLDRFLENHKRIVSIVDSDGLRGRCTESAEFTARVGVSDEEMGYHSTLFGIDGYVAEAVPGTFCTRDAIKKMEEVLGTALV